MDSFKNFITRRGTYKTGLKYFNKSEKRILLKGSLKDYVKSLKIPPGYPEATINLNKRAKVLVLSIDSKGRKQYTYNQSFIKKRTDEKYCKLIRLGRSYPEIVKNVNKSLQKRSKDNTDILNLMLHLIIHCNFRIGGEAMHREYGSVGVSTLQKKHIKSKGSDLIIEFHGKKQVINCCKVEDKRAIKFIKSLASSLKHPNDRLFCLIGANGEDRIAKDADLKRYLSDIAGVTPKQFRTWQSNVLLIEYLGCNLPTEINERKKNIKCAIERVAKNLHHTSAICKKSYLLEDLIKIMSDNPDDWRTYCKSVDNKYKGSDKKRYTISEFRFLQYLYKVCKSTMINKN
jgi:DNA topoisomerase I